MQQQILKWLLGEHAASSKAGWVVLALSLYMQLTAQGFDYKLSLIGVGIFFVLRYLNEGGVDAGKLLNSVLALRSSVEGLQDQLKPSELIVGQIAQSPDIAIRHAGWQPGVLAEMGQKQVALQEQLEANQASIAQVSAQEETLNEKLAANTAPLNPDVRARL